MNGLTTEEVNERRKQGLVNDCQVSTSRTYTDIIIKNVFTPLNIILFILGAALLILGNLLSSLSATGIILVNIIISTIQEMRAKRRLDRISLLTRPKVTVVRDGKEIQIDQKDIVKDDLIILRAGEQALVDGIFEKCTSVEMDESVLTGESSTVRKNAGDSVYSGTICITGEGQYTVTAFGHDSLASKMLADAKKFTSKKTPLQMETESITSILMGLAFVLLAISVVIELLKGVNFFSGDDISSVLEIFVICLDIIPVALFLLITLTYMIAAIRMSDTGVLLQRFNSVESISHVDTVCMDKTGTITTNKLVYESAIHFIPESEAEDIIRMFSNTTGSRNKTMDTLANRFGPIDAELVDEIQFSSARKYSAVKVRCSGNVHTLYSGAWNVIREHMDNPEEIDGIIQQESSKGLRTLVICSSDDHPLFENDQPVIHKLKPVSVISIKDEVRPDCRETIQVFMDNGMDLKVISGDDPVTVDSLFKIANIPGERIIISGQELESIPDDQLDDIVLKTNIFGRMKPEHKEKVIEVLKRNRRYVAMIGDGVNDVKSLKSAQVGVSLESGSGAARGVADMILVNDNFSALPKALIEGRRTVSGIRDILKVYLARNFALAIMFIAVFFTIGMLPMLPIQNLFYAFVSVTVIAFFMTVFAQPDENKELILPNVLRFVIPSALTVGIIGAIVYALSWMLTSSGFIVLDLSYIDGLTDFFHMSKDEIIKNFLVWRIDGSDINYSEIVARNCMVLFASITGALQLLIVCPRYKFLSPDGRLNKRKLPIILVAFVLLLVVLMYAFFPMIYVTIGMILPTAEMLMIILPAVAIAFVTILFITKHNAMERIVTWFEKNYLKKLDKEYTKGDVVSK